MKWLYINFGFKYHILCGMHAKVYLVNGLGCHEAENVSSTKVD